LHDDGVADFKAAVSGIGDGAAKFMTECYGDGSPVTECGDVGAKLGLISN
jgi:hypothetical protein